ncbi:glycosyltransferase [Bacteroides sp. 519]|uniref:glycosyltransferase n=1 Tax=Bacteroides sp. 519 TaxID=2302937 RepID=UPI0013D7E708|nr:glycosyltransferase [Bacteroides sp. 519]NDV58985.1 glycosyltransferase [Bacteroides sp. 519]
MKILICSKRFYPHNVIGAVRPTNIAKNLQAFGHEVTVITYKPDDHDFEELDNLTILRVSQSTFIEKWKKRIESTSINSLKRSFLSIQIERLFAYLYEYDWYLQAKKKIKKISNKEYDVAISSYAPLSSLYLGYCVYTKGIAKYWIADFRDNIQSEGSPKILNCLLNKLEKRVYNKANALTFVSKGQQYMFCRSVGVPLNSEKKTHVIYNGFEDELIINKSSKSDCILRLAYTGRLYNGKRDVSLLLKALSSLISDGCIEPSYVKFIYAGNDSDVLQRQMKAYKNIESCVEIVGYLDKKEIKSLQERCDILVALSWNTEFEQGILTGKFLEYLCSYKPIISITSGELAHSELSQMINDMDLGIACEYINKDNDFQHLKKYICEQYQLVQKGEPLSFCPDLNKIKQYQYFNQIRKFEKISFELMEGEYL